ncbi:MAG: methyl-accepting chemotaxis protein [Bacteroidota bacterium]|jgi:methyl-accepting chemotaxis protein|nr:methyl-accepting chemotaxis protein [Bacteroidota bacterium]
MRWFTNLKTKYKLLIGFGVVIAFLLALIAIESTQSGRSLNEYRTMQEYYLPINQTGDDLIADLLRERLLCTQLLDVESVESSSARFRELREAVLQQRREAEASESRVQSLLTIAERQTEGDDIRDALRNVNGQYGKLAQVTAAFTELLAQALPFVEQGDRDGLQSLHAELAENALAFNSAADLFGYELDNLFTASQARIESIEDTALLGRVLIFGIGIVLVIFLASVISRLISHPLSLATEIAERLGQGDTTIPIHTDRKDEVGELLHTLEKLRANSDHEAQVAARIADGDLTVEITPLSEKDILGKALSAMVLRLRTQTREMIEGINVLAAATAELSSTMVQIGAGARETASAVNETASTLVEVKQASQLSNTKAKTISDNTQQTLRVSHDGVDAISKSIQSMENIREQMRGIAESIIKLSEQGQAIGEIVTSVNDLAEQSNILAVNAAIEAAKAGEYGKGFTVVAKEIRNHAEQSKQATSKVRSILIDTQKATASAVMVAERGTKLAEDGAQLSSQSGKAIQTVMQGINETAESMVQIAASAKEQVVGLDQVTTAIQHIKLASEQNVESIHQVELTAQNLKELGTRLQRFVERYKL